MKPLQYINKIFCTLLVFTTGNKSYSQREIHPLEPMFTYDYALKYYQNTGLRNDFVKDFWLIDNFKAIVGMETVEVYGIENYPKSGTFLHSGNIKYVYFYNIETGFLQKSVVFALSNNSKIIKTLEERYFDYSIDSLHTTINVERVVFEDKIKTYKQLYMYDENECLSKLVTENNDTILISESVSEDGVQIIQISINDSINVVKYNQDRSSTNHSDYTFPNDSLYFTKRVREPSTSLGNQFLDQIQYNNYEITYQYSKFAFAGASYYLIKKGTLLFNKKHQLIDYKIEQFPWGIPNFSSQWNPISTTVTINEGRKADHTFIQPTEFKKTYYKKETDKRWIITTFYPNSNSKRRYNETVRIKKDKIINNNKVLILYK